MHADRSNRVALLLLGLLLLAAGAAGVLAAAGTFGSATAGRALADNPVSRYVGDNGRWLWPVAALAAFLVYKQLGWFLPKLRSTWVAAFGALGRARVLRSAVLRPGFRRGGTVVLVAFEVTPHGGGASFIDEEVLLLLDTSVPKVDPGNIIAVRFDEPGRRRVFPVTPINVIDRL